MGLKEIFIRVLILTTLLLFIKARRKFGFNFFIVFSCYLFINLAVEISPIIALYYHTDNMMVYNISILTEGLAFCYLFYCIQHTNPVLKKALLISASVFILFWLINFFFIQKNTTLDTYTYFLSSIILATFSLITIYRFIFEDIVDNPFHNFFFWTSIGVLFCYIGNLPFLGMFNILAQQSKVTAMSLWFISEVVNSLLYFMTITGILCHQPKK